MPSRFLRTHLEACSILLGLGEPAAKLPSAGGSSKKDTLAGLLQRRLIDYHAARGVTYASNSSPGEASVKLGTARVALQALQELAELVRTESVLASTPSTSTRTSVHASSSPTATLNPLAPSPQMSVKEMQIVSQLAGVVARWGIANTVLDGVLPSSLTGAKSASKTEGTSKIVEIIEEEDEETRKKEQNLDTFVRGVLGLIEPRTTELQLRDLVIPQVLLPMMGALVQLSHNTSYHISSPRDWAKESLDQLLTSRPPTIIISNLLALLSSPSPSSSTSAWLKPLVSSLLSRQLLRPGGVRSLLLVVIGVGIAGGGADNIDTRKLDMLTRLLRAKSDEMDNQTYYTSILTQLLAIIDTVIASSLTPPSAAALQPSAPPTSILQATIFVLSHFFLSPPHPSCTQLLSTSFYSSLLPLSYPSSRAPTSSSSKSASDVGVAPPLVTAPQVLSTLTRLSLIALYAPPLPSFIQTLVSPILPPLLALYAFTHPSPERRSTVGVPDPRFGEETRVLLDVWAKGVQEDVDGVMGVSRAIEEGEEGRVFGGIGAVEFAMDPMEGGGVFIKEKSEERAGEQEGIELIVDVEPIIEWLKDLGKEQLSGALLVRWLDEMQVLRKEKGIRAAKKSLTRLQLVLKMVDELGSEILKRPEQIVAFIAHALEDDEEEGGKVSEAEKPRGNPTKAGIRLVDLKIIDDEEIEAAQADEIEDDEPIVPGVGADEMRLTALTLLLAVLEANEELTPTTNGLLSTIFNKLDQIASSSSSDLVPPLAREAKLVLSAREALLAARNPSSSTSTADDCFADSRKTYQTALRYLQDPLLPVRAQGLALLRGLVHSPDSFLGTDPALVPAVLDIFVQSLSEEDSFLYLNAIQGLSSLADVHGKQIVQRLTLVYRGGSTDSIKPVGEGERGRQELDKRLRMAEALTRVIERAGEAYAVFVDDLVPTLLMVLKTSKLPTPLRSSAVTVLGTCVETSLNPIRGWIASLAEACLTLLSIESRPIQAKVKVEPVVIAEPLDDSEKDDSTFENPFASSVPKTPKRPEETHDPISVDPKHPAFRRSAILFLSLLLRSIQRARQQAQDSVGGYDETTPFGSGGMRLPGSSSLSSSRSTPRPSISSREDWGVDMKRMRIVLGYVRQTDADALVRHQAGEVLDEIGGA